MTMSRASVLLAALLAAVVVGPATAAAQESNFVAPAAANPQAAAGWSLTPSLSYSGAWDDNVLVRGNGDATAADFVSFVDPRATLDFNGRRGQIAASYDGAFEFYRELS